MHPLANVPLVQFNITPQELHEGFWWGSEAGAKVLLMGHVRLTDSINEQSDRQYTWSD